MNIPRFYISRSQWGAGYEIHFGCTAADGKFLVANPVTMTMHDDGVSIPTGAMLRLDRKDDAEGAMQSLLDQLWNLGFRPADIGSAGHLAATQAHLKDMRALVVNFTGATLP